MHFMQFMIKGGFMCTHTPKITGVSEGGSAVFKVNYFKEQASLAQSPQLYKQMLINGGINRVFEVGPVYRAEDSNTHRHLCEYIGLHAEMQIKEHYFEVIDFVDALFVDLFDHLAKNCSEMLDIIQEQYPCERLKYLQQNVRLKYSDGIKMLQESGFPIQEPQDLNNKAELMLGKLVLEKLFCPKLILFCADLGLGLSFFCLFCNVMYCVPAICSSSDQLLQHRYKTDFFILYEFPLAVRPFYTMPSGQERNPGSYSNSFDAYIRGQEVLSGSQRIHNKSLLIKRIDERGYIKAIFQQFTDTFGCGAPPRGGFGAGLERLVMLYLGVPDIRIASLFPHDPGRLVP
ncbi:unnamed protein product [Triticum turgidum subsp. durum]|uniref:aspartate--tRNA ligase n=1 Tax=Triticum turgidum subsp. durum TaxID=4567 RepID=A0A9R0Q0S1_TRITD|nr:unnamed protein product [Triticum turgidum subsp. durum]